MNNKSKIKNQNDNVKYKNFPLLNAPPRSLGEVGEERWGSSRGISTFYIVILIFDIYILILISWIF